MLHRYKIQKGYYGLRPVRLEDAAFIVRLRTLPERSRFVNATSPDVSKQEDWLRQYYERCNDYYFVIENSRSKESEGTLGIYGVNELERSAEWGRWIVLPGSKAAIPGACMAFDLAFSVLKLDSLYSYVAAGHSSVLRLLCALGMQREGLLHSHLCIGGIKHDAVKLHLSHACWENGN